MGCFSLSPKSASNRCKDNGGKNAIDSPSVFQCICANIWGVRATVELVSRMQINWPMHMKLLEKGCGQCTGGYNIGCHFMRSNPHLSQKSTTLKSRAYWDWNSRYNQSRYDAYVKTNFQTPLCDRVAWRSCIPRFNHMSFRDSRCKVQPSQRGWSNGLGA